MKHKFFLSMATLFLFLPASGSQTVAQSVLNDLCTLSGGRSCRVSSTRRLPDRLAESNNFDNFRVGPGETHTLARLEGPGVITHMWITFLGPEPQAWAPEGAANHQEIVLRIFWDGREAPGVETPFGDFFACGFGQRMEVKSIPVQVESGASYNCFWKMPFRESARIEIENQSSKQLALLYYNIDWIKRDSLPEDTPYFHAQYRQEYPAKSGCDYLVFEGEGRGHYVGTVLSVRSRSPGWFGEGDEKITLDDDEKPSIWGTGTEDYFLCAWGLREGLYPCFGVPYTDGGHVLGGKTCAYRWHLHDPIVFQKRIRVELEHFGWISVDENPDHKSMSWNERQDDYASVAFWYQNGIPKRFAELPSCAERTLPEIDIVLQGREFADEPFHGKGEAIVQTGALWTGCSQLFFKPKSIEEGWIEIPFEVKRKEPRRLLVKLTTSYDYGIYDLFLDGVKLREGIDLYSPETDVKDFPLLDFWPEAGEHKVRLQCTGKNPLSKDDWIGLDSLRLRERRPRVEEYAWDMNENWKEKPILY